MTTVGGWQMTASVDWGYMHWLSHSPLEQTLHNFVHSAEPSSPQSNSHCLLNMSICFVVVVN